MILRENPIADLLVGDIPRNLVLAVEDNLMAGAHRAHSASQGMHPGHAANVLGQLRHFHMNEAYHRALEMCNAQPTPVSGNGLIVGRSGRFLLARFNTRLGVWNTGARSKIRKELAIANRAIEHFVQASLFSSSPQPPLEGVAFFVSAFSGSLTWMPEAPISIYIAVPDPRMSGWLFRESVSLFMQRYKPGFVEQADTAKPKLKKGVQKRDGGERQ